MHEELLEQFKTFKTGIETQVSGAVRSIDELKSLIHAPGSGGGGGQHDTETPGGLLVKAEGFLASVKQHGNGRFVVGRMWPEMERKTTISESAVGSGTSGVLMPERIPGIRPLARRKLRIRDLMNAAPAQSSAVDFIKESTFTNAAYPQTEGSAKAESANTFTVSSAPVATIAHWIPATSQVLDDIPELQRFINENLRYGLKKTEEEQILRGSGVGDSILGLMTAAGLYAGTYNASGDTIVDKVRHAILELNTVDEYPTGIVLSPKDAHDADLIKTEVNGANTGKYVIGDPLGGVIQVPTLWGLSIVVSNTMPAGQFLIGDFAGGAEIRDRMDARIDISTEHSDYFTRNMVAIRCEERLALPIFRTTSFMRGSF